MRTSFGLYGWMLTALVVASVALAFVAPRPRLLWVSLLAVVAGYCAHYLGFGWYAMFEPVLLGAAYAARSEAKIGRAAVIGLPWGVASIVGTIRGCSDCGDPVVWGVFFLILVGAALALLGAAAARSVRALARRVRD